MAKVMLVEDDNNLREIYEARLLAEGYQIISAKDGEEALALAVKEKPDLIIADVMMPKISGFDMLDILRSTPETKETKVIMMTALSQAEDKARADKLGADRYLVKSQVTLEDVANVTREVLGGQSSSGSPLTDTPKPSSEPPQPASPASANDGPGADNASTTAPTTTSIPVSTPPDDQTKNNSTQTQTTADESTTVKEQVKSFEQAPAQAPKPVDPVSEPQSKQPPGSNIDKTNDIAEHADNLANMVNDIMNKKQPQQGATSQPAPTTQPPGGFNSDRHVIQPITNPTPKPDLQELLAREEAKESGQTPPPSNPPATSDPNSVSL